MNLIFRELKYYRIGFIFWCLGVVTLIGSGMAKYATLIGTDQSINKIMDQLPRSIQTIFGMNGLDLSNISDYFGVLFIYLALMLAIHAVLLGSGIISKEERDRTSEFLFVKPVSRTKIISTKILAGLINIAALNLFTLISSLYIVDYFNEGASVDGDILVLMLGLAFLQLIFYFIGTATAAVSKKPKLVPSIVTSVILSTFMINILINIEEKFDLLKYITPFKYFEANDLLINGHLNSTYLYISLVLITLLVFVTYKTYNDRDLKV